MKKLILAAAIAAAFAANFSYAEEPPKPDNEVSFNAALTSDYRYRGISQSRLQPALSAGADYVNNPSGFYAGTWLSTIKWISDANNGSSKVELDLYAGKRGDIAEGVGYDVGVLSYVYPSNGLNPSANTTEVYGQVGMGPATLKYSHALTNLFGFVDSKNSGYLDASANIDIAEGTQLNLHAGHQTVKGKGNGMFSYTDWKVGVTKDFGIVSASIAAVGTNTDAYVGPNAKNLGKTSLVVAVSKTF